MILIKSTNFEKARKEIQEITDKNQIIVFSSSDDELNRKIIEKQPINILLISLSDRKDRQKQKDSGLNQVLAKIAKKNNIHIGINLDELLEEKDPLYKAKILSRIRQNVEICNKNKVHMVFISPNKNHSRNKHDLLSLGKVLGMPTWMTKQPAY